MRDVFALDDTGARTTEDIFTARSQPMPIGRIFGGQVLAQSVLAAGRTLPPERIVHSMHGYFLRAGASDTGVTIAVDRIHDGRSFSTRRAQVYQEGRPIFSMIASFQDSGPGLEHQATIPSDIPRPDELPPVESTFGPKDADSRHWVASRPIEFRYVTPPVFVTADGTSRPTQAVWMRVKARLPDDPALHRAALAYASDMSIQEPILRAHGIVWFTPGLKLASLDHAMWWQRPARVDEWLLYTQESPSARGGRGLSTGRIFTAQGELAAVVAQEVMVRLPKDSHPHDH